MLKLFDTVTLKNDDPKLGSKQGLKEPLSMYSVAAKHLPLNSLMKMGIQ